jgi:DNA repair exonuclease SbcCD nuclease subunit
MTKIAIISDSHWGVRNSNIHFLDMTKKFLDDVFFPVIDIQGIDTILHLGDLVDQRKQISFLTASRLREDFLDVISKKNLKMHAIAGNHDCFFKNTNKVNALTELIDGKYPNVKLYIDPEEVVIGGKQILFVPWICDNNKEKTMEMIQTSNSLICMGHLELEGFEMFRGSVNSHGENSRKFDRFDIVLSGHYHHRSNRDNVFYLGSHGEFTWSDYDDPRGFHIMDLEKNSLTFYENPYRMFRKVWYNDIDKTLEQILEVDTTQYRNSMVKLIVQNKTNPYWFDLFCVELEKNGLINLQIVEDHMNLDMVDENNIVDESQSTLDIFRNHINQTEMDVDRVKLNRVISDLYNEALALE